MTPHDPDELVSACETIWELYGDIGDDDMSDGTYDRNDFNAWLIQISRFVTAVTEMPSDVRETVMAAFQHLSQVAPDEARRDHYFEQVMDAEQARVQGDSESEDKWGG